MQLHIFHTHKYIMVSGKQTISTMNHHWTDFLPETDFICITYLLNVFLATDYIISCLLQAPGLSVWFPGLFDIIYTSIQISVVSTCRCTNFKNLGEPIRQAKHSFLVTFNSGSIYMYFVILSMFHNNIMEHLQVLLILVTNHIKI